MIIATVLFGASILASRTIGHTQQEPSLVANNTNEQTISSFDNERTNQGLSNPINQEQVEISSVPLFFRGSLLFQAAHRTQRYSLTPRFSLSRHLYFSRTFNRTFRNPQNTPLLIRTPTNETRTREEAQGEQITSSQALTNPPLLITTPTNETRTREEAQGEQTAYSQALTNTPSTQNQNQNIIQVEEKTLWAYNKFKDTTDRISDRELQNLYASPSNTTIKRETENLNSGFQKLGAKLLQEALEEKDKPILKSFYKFMNCFPTKLWTSYDWKTSREIRIEFGKKLILQSTSPEEKERIITIFFEEKDRQAIRQILS